MIEIKNISKSFSGVQVLDDVSFTFQKGKTNLIIGKSGSGKSVLTKCIVGLLEPDEGEIIYDGRSFRGINNKERKEIRKELGMLFQGGALFDSLSVLLISNNINNGPKIIAIKRKPNNAPKKPNEVEFISIPRL